MSARLEATWFSKRKKGIWNQVAECSFAVIFSQSFLANFFSNFGLLSNHTHRGSHGPSKQYVMSSIHAGKLGHFLFFQGQLADYVHV